VFFGQLTVLLALDENFLLQLKFWTTEQRGDLDLHPVGNIF